MSITQYSRTLEKPLNLIPYFKCRFCIVESCLHSIFSSCHTCNTYSRRKIIVSSMKVCSNYEKWLLSWEISNIRSILHSISITQHNRQNRVCSDTLKLKTPSFITENLDMIIAVYIHAVLCKIFICNMFCIFYCEFFNAYISVQQCVKRLTFFLPIFIYMKS